jgi:hypothetical protein
MKSVFLIPIEAVDEKERRRHPRRLEVPRRLQANRRDSRPVPAAEQTRPVDRRMPGQRRRRPDRRLGLNIDLDRLNL